MPIIIPDPVPAGDLVFDAAGSNPDGTDPGTPLSVWANTTYAVTEHSWPAPNQTVQWASSVDTEGSLPASAKHENRQISMTIEVMNAAGLRALLAKVGKVARERATLKWTLPNSEAVIFDLLSVDSCQPSFDIAYYVNAGAFCTVSLSFTAAPYGRGPSVQLADHTEATLPALTFVETALKGDWYGLGSLVVDNDQASTTQAAMIWGLESRNIVSTSIPLFVEAEDATYFSGAVAEVGPAGASGSTTNKVTGHVAGNGTYPDNLVGHFTTIGTFNIYARVQAAAANTAPITLRMRWGNVGSTNPTTNATVTLNTAWNASWRLVNLGQVTARKQLLTSAGDWYFSVQGTTTTTLQAFYLDYFLIVPVAERSGILTDTASPVLTSASAPNGGVILKWNGVQRYGAGYNGIFPGYDTPASYEGEYLFMPPAGAEARTVRVIVKFSRGQLTQGADAGIDDISARLTYTPRYLVVPEP